MNDEMFETINIRRITGEESKEVRKSIIDGYAILAVNEKGDKAYIVDRKCHDHRLENYVQWCDMNVEDQLLPDGLSDCLVMVFFRYQCISQYNWEYTEYEEVLTIEKYVIMQDNYKAFWQDDLSFLVTHDGCADYPREYEEMEKDWIEEDVNEWEEFYDGDFTVSPRYCKKKD